MSYPSIVDAPLPGEQTKARSTVRGDQSNRADSPPNPPAAGAGDEAESKAATKGASGGGVQKNAQGQRAGGAATPKTKAAPPAAPADDNEQIDLRPAPGSDETVRRDSLRPVYPRLRTVDRRNVLIGSVETDDGQPRAEVPVTVVNRSNTAIRHSGLSSAFGGFAIRVPDGRWSVRVTMPSGNVQTVRDITVTGGRIMDNLEAREVHNLIISY
jgi:hypothetical protein